MKKNKMNKSIHQFNKACAEEEWLKCNDFEYDDRYIEQLQQENQKYKELIDKLEKYIEKETRIYGLSMSIELGTHFDNILCILKEVE